MLSNPMEFHGRTWMAYLSLVTSLGRGPPKMSELERDSLESQATLAIKNAKKLLNNFKATGAFPASKWTVCMHLTL